MGRRHEEGMSSHTKENKYGEVAHVLKGGDARGGLGPSGRPYQRPAKMTRKGRKAPKVNRSRQPREGARPGKV